VIPEETSWYSIPKDQAQSYMPNNASPWREWAKDVTPYYVIEGDGYGNGCVESGGEIW